MSNNYSKMTPEQRQRWNHYSNEYSKLNFRSYNVKFRIKEDKEIINFLDTHGSVTETIRRLIEAEIQREKGE